MAKEFLAKADVPAPLVVLDTEVLELDETVARNLGLQFTQPVISTTFSELSPIDTGNGTPRLIGLQPITRSPLSLGVQLNLLIQRGTARVLADPRITTLSGRTATIRAGDTIGILTTVGGGVGTATTTQLQTFQTGVTLDITPIVADDDITVALHPVVNSLSGILNGVPQIATRDAQTTVHLKDNQTLIIGGLIQESNNRTETKVPILGDLPAIGSIFRNQQVNNTRNELIVVVTPHILLNGATAPPASPPLPAIPTPQPLPTLPPRTALPAARPFVARTPIPQRTPSNLLSTAPPLTPLISPSASPSVVPSPGTSGKPSSTPMPTPSAFAQANTYTYGQAPQSTFAKPTDPVQVFFASLSPTILSAGATVRVNAITTSNAQRVTLIAGSTSTQLTQVGPGQWQGAFPFPASGSTVGQTTLQLSLSASRQDGTSASIAIPVNVSP